MAYQKLSSLLPDYRFDIFDFDPRSTNLIEEYITRIVEDDQSPKVLLGYSGGGNIAFEVAKALEQRGIGIDCLILIDSYRKKRQPVTLPFSIQEMKKEALNGWNYMDIDGYYDLINLELHDHIGHVHADVHLINSTNRHIFGDRLVDGSNYFQGWSGTSTQHFAEHAGAGPHHAMLQPPHVATNSHLIRSIMKRYYS